MPVKLTCVHCGLAYTRDPNEAEKSRYCSRQCANTARRLPPSTCEQCGSIFVSQGGRGHPNRFCSNACYTAFRRGLSADERAALMKQATAMIIGTKRSLSDLEKRARTKQDRCVLSGDEAEIMAAMHTAGLFPIPLYAFGKYNIDFAFPATMIAIEYHGGNWHQTPLKQSQDETKAAALRDAGWTLLVFPRLARPRRTRTDAGNRSVAIEDIVRQVSEAMH